MDIAHKLYSVYMEPYKPPDWVLNPMIWKTLHFSKSCLYYDCNDNIDEVIKLAQQREPVNMGMKRLYYQNKMQKLFGYIKGYYGILAEVTHKLPPTIAIYAYTPVNVSGIATPNMDHFKYAHVINLIGLAMDSPLQPDRQLIDPNDTDLILCHYYKIWRIAFTCCRRQGLKFIHTSFVGGGAFSPKGRHDYVRRIYRPVMSMISAEFPDITIIEKFFPEFVVPSSFGSISQKQMDQTLYVNAWDPWSIVGNGNSNDNSLDGYWGRSSALAVLCWPVINKQMKVIPLKLTN